MVASLREHSRLRRAFYYGFAGGAPVAVLAMIGTGTGLFALLYAVFGWYTGNCFFDNVYLGPIVLLSLSSGCRWLPLLSGSAWIAVVAASLGAGIGHALLCRAAIRIAWRRASSLRSAVLLVPHVALYALVTWAAAFSATGLTNPWISPWEQMGAATAGPLILWASFRLRNLAAKVYAKARPESAAANTAIYFVRYYTIVPPDAAIGVAREGARLVLEAPLDTAEAQTTADVLRTHLHGFGDVVVRSTLAAEERPDALGLARSGLERHRLEGSDRRTRAFMRVLIGFAAVSVAAMIVGLVTLPVGFLTGEDIADAFRGLGGRARSPVLGLPSEVVTRKLDLVASQDRCSRLARDTNERLMTTLERLGIVERTGLLIPRIHRMDGVYVLFRIDPHTLACVSESAWPTLDEAQFASGVYYGPPLWESIPSDAAWEWTPPLRTGRGEGDPQS